MSMEIKCIIYTAGIIKDNSKLIRNIPAKYKKIFAHHMTIKFGGFDEISLPNYIGKKFTFIANKLYSDENAIALTGYITNREIAKFMKSINQKAHITIATSDNVQPVYSNELIKTKSFVKINKIKIKMQAGALCIVENNNAKWIFK